jgi:Inorganic pyrophosphatase
LGSGGLSRGEILLEARPIGGLRMVERGEADDKILAVLLGDPTYGEIVDVSQLPLFLEIVELVIVSVICDSRMCVIDLRRKPAGELAKIRYSAAMGRPFSRGR